METRCASFFNFVTQRPRITWFSGATFRQVEACLYRRVCSGDLSSGRRENESHLDGAGAKGGRGQSLCRFYPRIRIWGGFYANSQSLPTKLGGGGGKLDDPGKEILLARE